MRLLSFRKPYELLPPVPEARMLTHGVAYKHGVFLTELGLDEIDAVLAQEGTCVWIGLHEPSANFLQKFQARFALHALALEDAYLAHQRPKVEEYGQVLFVVLHTMERRHNVLHSGEIHLFLGQRFLLSICHQTTLNVAQVRQRCEAMPEQLAHGPGVLLYTIMDLVVDLYQPVVDEWLDEVETAETRLFQHSLDRDGLEQLYHLRRTVQTLRAMALPLVEVCATLMRPYYSRATIPDELRVYFRDTYDHLSQIVRLTESGRETLFTAMQMHLSLLTVQQNDIVKRLAGWGAIVFVPTLVGSIYGMNFRHMPELEWPYGYPIALTVTAVACLWLYRRFKKYDWL